MQLCKTDIVCRLQCTLADTDHDGLSVSKSQTLFTIGIYALCPSVSVCKLRLFFYFLILSISEIKRFQ